MLYNTSRKRVCDSYIYTSLCKRIQNLITLCIPRSEFITRHLIELIHCIQECIYIKTKISKVEEVFSELSKFIYCILNRKRIICIHTYIRFISVKIEDIAIKSSIIEFKQFLFISICFNRSIAEFSI